MAYNLSYLRNRVMVDKLDDDEYDASVVDNFLNDVQREIFNQFELPFMEVVFEGGLPENNASFNFPSDYSLVQSLVVTSPDNSQQDITKNYLQFRDFNKNFPTPLNNEPGAPRYWTTYAGKLYLDRPTDQDYILTSFYLKTPTTMVDDTVEPGIPESSQEVLILGAYYRCLERNEDFDLARDVKSDYLVAVNNMVKRAARRQAGTPSIMNQSNRVGYRARPRG